MVAASEAHDAKRKTSSVAATQAEDMLYCTKNCRAAEMTIEMEEKGRLT